MHFGPLPPWVLLDLALCNSKSREMSCLSPGVSSLRSTNPWVAQAGVRRFTGNPRENSRKRQESTFAYPISASNASKTHEKKTQNPKPFKYKKTQSYQRAFTLHPFWSPLISINTSPSKVLTPTHVHLLASKCSRQQLAWPSHPLDPCGHLPKHPLCRAWKRGRFVQIWWIQPSMNPRFGSATAAKTGANDNVIYCLGKKKEAFRSLHGGCSSHPLRDL